MNNVYHGLRVRRGAVVTKNGGLIPIGRSLLIRNHSPTGFAWGYTGSGPHQLALAILLEEFGPELAELWYDEFTREVVAGWQEAHWQINTAELRRWMDPRLTDEDLNPPKPLEPVVEITEEVLDDEESDG